MENQNSPKKREIHLTKSKHLDLFIFLFIGGALVASIFFVLNIFGVFTKVDAYVAIKATVENGINYDTDMTCVLYFKGNVPTTNSKKGAATKAYTEALKQAYLHYDPSSTYLESASIGQINNNVGEAVQIDSELYKTLKEAYDKSNIEENNYSIFAGPIYDEWYSLFSFAQEGDLGNDPINSAEEKDYLEQLTAIINDASNYSLEFLDGNKVKLTISEQYEKFRSDYKVGSPIISLNILEIPYKMKAAKSALEEAGFTEGYLSSQEGYGITLKDISGISHAIYNVNAGIGEIGYVDIEGLHAYKITNMFNHSKQERVAYYYYSVKDNENVVHYRNNNINLKTGFPNEYYLSTLLSKSGDEIDNLIEVAIYNQQLLLVDSLEKENDFLNKYGSLSMYFNKQSEPNSYFFTKNLKEKIYIFNSEVYTINIINKEE